jgi:hypothetical protein
MVAMTAINAPEIITSTISPVPFKTKAAKLRSLPRILAYNLYPQFFTFSQQQCLRVLIKPMGQSPVKHARERPSFTVFNLFQVFDNNRLNLRKVYLFKSSTYHRLCFCLGVLLTFGKLLSSFVERIASSLTITKNKPVFI